MRLKKIVTLLLSASLLLSAAGCGARSTVDIDSSKTTLTVGNWNGGVGTEWLNAAIEKFEEKYKDVSFEEGKKGVQVIIGSNNKTTMEGETLKDIVLSDDMHDEVFFTEGVFYQWWARNGKMLDLTEYVNETLSDFGEAKSIADKMDEANLNALTIDGKIYALPFWESSYCMVYNATLFDEEGWYIAEDGSFTNANGKLGTGPDGQTGTYDDGMPATYEQFYALLDEIKKDNCTPFQFPGASQEYFTWLVAEMAADNMGYDQYMMNFNFTGTAELVKTDTINWDTMEFETENVEITKENAYELSRQPGIVYATKFAETVLQDTSNYDVNKSLSGSFKITQSQLEFVRNPTISSQKNVAIMVDGFWWENEAVASFKETYGTNATKYDADMEYKVMPLPKATQEDVGSENVVVAALDTYCFIKSNIAPEKVDVATKFLQFVHTDAQMAEFTQMTSLTKPYDYEVDTEGLTSFAQSMIEMMENSKVALPMDTNELYTYSPADFRLVRLMRTKYAPDQEAGEAVANVLTTKESGAYKYSAQAYYEGIYNYRKNYQWKEYEDILK